MATTGVTHLADRNQESTVWIGGLEPQVSEEVIYELMLQVGPIVQLNMPRDKVSNQHQGFAFCEYRSEIDCDYAIKVLNMVKLFGKAIKINKAAADKQTVDIGANLFIGGLDGDVDDRLLFDTFTAFGGVLSAKVMCDPETGKSKGFGFIAFDTFEASDTAIAAMNGQYLCGSQIHIQYAFKKDGSQGERHGSAAERLLAASGAQFGAKPHTRFAGGTNAVPIIPNPALPVPQVLGGYGVYPGVPMIPMPTNMMPQGAAYPQMFAPPPLPQYYQPPPIPQYSGFPQ